MGKKSRKPRLNRGRPTGATRTLAVPPSAPSNPPARSFMPMIAAGIVILIVVVAGSFLFQGDGDGGDPTATTQATGAATFASPSAAATPFPVTPDNEATSENAADAVRQPMPTVSGALRTAILAGSIFVPGT